MIISEKTAELVSELEYIIGDSCYNPDSYNGWTGEYGASFRYPVWYSSVDDQGNVREEKIWGRLSDRTSAKSISSAFYKFAANHLCIGNALQELLTHIEKRYGISFDEMEEKKTDE